MRVTPILFLLVLCTFVRGQIDNAEFPEIAEYYSFPIETHEVTTSDGYILTLFRIPYGRNDDEYSAERTPVITVHGIPADSDALVMNGPDRSIPFYLADNGFDVWLINMRGNFYSRSHVELDPEDDEFWQYDMQDHYLDFQAGIEYILQETGHETLTATGVSHGATTFLISLALEPEWFAERVDVFIAFVPLSVMVHTTNMYFSIMTNPSLINSLRAMGFDGEVLPKSALNNIPYDGV